jgi:hypothetical protein
MQPDKATQKRRRLIIVSIILVVAVLIGASVLNRLSAFNITVQAPEGSRIFVALSPEGEMKEIGKNTVSYLTKQKEPIHFRIVRNNEESMISLEPQKFDSQTVEVSFENTVSAQKFLEGPLINPLVERDTLYGLSATTRTLSSFGLSGFKPVRQSFVGLPFMKEVAWRDSRNFVYEKFAGGVGAFINDVDRGTSWFGGGTDPGKLYGLSQYYNKPLAIIGSAGIYTSSDLGRT